MTYPLFSFTSTPQNQDQSANAGMQQYAQQGQNLINAGQAQTAAANPMAAAGHMNLQNAFQGAQQNTPQLPAQAAQQGLMGGAAMGQPGPTPQALALAQGLLPTPQVTNAQQFLNPGS